MPRVAPLALALVASLGGCRGDVSGARGKTVVITTAADPEILLPPFARSLAAKAVTDLLFDRLADTGPGLNTVGDAGFEPRLAERWEWSADSLRLTLHLNPRARWHDSSAVRASDVRFAYGIYADSTLATADGPELRAAVDSISVGDSVTCTVWYHQRSPEQFYRLVSALVPLPEHALAQVPRNSLRESAFGRAPVGNGPFRFVSWQKSAQLELAAVEGFYRGRAKLDRVIWSVAPDMAGAARKLIGGEADFLESLTPDVAADAARNPALRVIRYGSFDYGFVRFNLRDGTSKRPHRILDSRQMRRALTMSLDRAVMVRSVFDSLGKVALGPFVRAQWSADTSLRQIPFDRAAAARLLDSLGWRAGPDGARSRGGKPLEFTLLVPASSRNRGRFAVLIQEQLRQVGVKVNIESLDFAAFLARIAKGDFDAATDALHPGVGPGGARQSWGSAGIHAGRGPNYGSYAGVLFDAHVDSALTARDVAAARAHFRAAYQAIVDDAPAIWLFEPVAIAGTSARLNTGVLRPDGWWMGLKDWTVGSLK